MIQNQSGFIALRANNIKFSTSPITKVIANVFFLELE